MHPISPGFLFRYGLLLAALACSSPALAAVDWHAGRTLKPGNPPLDLATSADGKWTFVLTEGGKVFIYSAEGELSDTIPVDPAMNHISVPGLGDRIYLSSSKNKTIQEILVEFIAKIDTAGSPFMGPAEAPVELVVFSDFQ